VPIKIATVASIAAWLFMVFALVFLWAKNGFKEESSITNLAGNEISC
jgi:hypothetical protein